MDLERHTESYACVCTHTHTENIAYSGVYQRRREMMAEMSFVSSELPGDLEGPAKRPGVRGGRGSQWIGRFLHP